MNIDYKILQATSAEALCARVKEYVGAGWRIGNGFVVKDGNFCQPMIFLPDGERKQPDPVEAQMAHWGELIDSLHRLFHSNKPPTA